MVNVSSIVDGTVFGYVVSLVLLGITLVQGWDYGHNNHDKWPLRTFVAVLVLLDIAETFCASGLIHHYLISHFGEVDVLKSPIKMISIDFAVTLVIIFMVHIFFARRLWMLGKTWWLPAVITLTSTAMLALGASAISMQISAQILDDFYQRRVMIELAVFHGLGVFTDILVTAGLSWTLSKTRTGFKTTRMVLQRILVFTVTRGILVCLVQVGHIVMYVYDPKNMLFWASLHLILTKLYVLTTLVTLNSRRTFRDTIQSAVADDLVFTHSAPSQSGHSNTTPRNLEDQKNRKPPIRNTLLSPADTEFSIDVSLAARGTNTPGQGSRY